jgi:hypothetical protein
MTVIKMKVHFLDDSHNLSLIPIRKNSADDIIIPKSDLTPSELPNSVSSNSLLHESSIVVLNEETHIDKTKLAISSIMGIGAGLAMMPIFNNEVYKLDNYGINVHEYETLFIISTLNTLLLISTCSIINSYKYFTDTEVTQQFSNNQKTALTVAKLGAVASSIVPLGLLWNVELHDQQVDNSEGFDKFVAWAAFSTIPLMVVKIIESYETMGKFVKGEYKELKLDSVGSKIMTYSIDILSAVARGLSFTAITSELCKNIGFEEDTANIIGIVVGGVLTNSVSAINEHFSMKNMFIKQDKPISAKKFAVGVVSAVEGMWFSLPTISAGLNFTSSWNPLLKGMLFAPYFVTKATKEASSMYNSIFRNPSNNNGNNVNVNV